MNIKNLGETIIVSDNNLSYKYINGNQKIEHKE